MSQTRKRTAWMWLANEEVRGLFLDVEDRVLTWVWQAGCHCADEDEIRQTVASFQQEGAPTLIGPLPADVAAEVDMLLEPAARRGA